MDFAIGTENEILYLLVDHYGSRFAVVTMLGYFPAEKNLFFLFPESEWAEIFGHAPFADHLAGNLGTSFDIVAGAGGNFVENQFLRHSAA